MDQSTKGNLVKAVGLIREGENKAAVPLLATILKTEPEFVRGWYLLGLALDDEEKKIRAFKRVLRLEPDHEKAKTQLERLKGVQPSAKENHSETNSRLPPVTASLPHDDFELPDWMQEENFDPSYYSTGALDPDVLSDYEEKEKEEDPGIPSWALPQPSDTKSEDLLADRLPTMDRVDEPVQRELQSDPLDLASPEVELTGYYDDGVEEDSVPDGFDETGSGETLQDEQVIAFLAEEENLGEQNDVVGEPTWLREMVENGEDGNNQKKKKQKKPKKILSPDQIRLRRKIITYVVVLLALIGLGAGGYYYQDDIKPYYEPYLPPIMTRIAPVTDLLTQGAPLTVLLTPGYNITPSATMPPPLQPTSEPTWTPSGGQSLVSTLSPEQRLSGTPVVIPTAVPLAEDVVTEMELIEEQVKSVRSLPGPLNVERELLTNSKLRQVMDVQLIDEETLTELRNEEIVLRALGFINSNYDLIQAALNARADALGGFYEPVENKIYVIGSNFGGIEKSIYAHEYAHTLQDANFDLNSLGLYPVCTKPRQACLATRALVEGEATLLHQQWLEQYPPDPGIDEILDYQPPSTLFEGELPPYYAMNTTFAYEYGLAFVSGLFEQGGWNAVNRVYADLPDTTEQILHPLKYQRGEAPLFLDHPDLSPVFRGDWELIRRDLLGEWESYLLLAYNDFPEAQRPEDEAASAAEGWGTDEYRVYYNPVLNDVFLSVYWIWETPEDADDFYDSLLDSIAARFETNEVEGPGENGRCFSFTQQTSCIYQNEAQILWLFSDNQEILEAAKERFTRFP